MGSFIKPIQIEYLDSWKLLRLKKKFNACAGRINSHCDGAYLADADKLKLLKELYEIRKEISAYE